MQLAVQRVRSGDCNILLDEEGAAFAFDCGSSNRDYTHTMSSSQFAYTAIEPYVAGSALRQVLVTHYDADHYNGLLQIPDTYRLQRAFLPYTIVDGKVAYTGAISRLLSIAPTKSSGFKIAKDIVPLFQKLEDVVCVDDIYTLKKGDSFRFGDMVFEVLWPDINNLLDKSVVRESAEIRQMYEAITERLVGGGRIRERQMVLENALDTYWQALPAFEGETEPGQNGALREERGQLLDTVQKAVEDILEARPSMLEMAKDQKMMGELRGFATVQYNALIKGMNHLSVVCQCENRLLMLGDAPREVLQHLYTLDKFKDEYACVKLPHHATAGYYWKNIPRAKYAVVCGSGMGNRKVSAKYIERDFASILCTDAHVDKAKYCAYGPDCPDNCVGLEREYRLNI